MSKFLTILVFSMAAIIGWGTAQIESLNEQLKTQQTIFEMRTEIEQHDKQLGMLQSVLFGVNQQVESNAHKLSWLKRGKIVEIKIKENNE